MALITIGTGAYKPTYNWGASHYTPIFIHILWMEEILHQLYNRWFIPLFVGFQPSKVVQDFVHPQYGEKSWPKRSWCVQQHTRAEISSKFQAVLSHCQKYGAWLWIPMGRASACRYRKPCGHASRNHRIHSNSFILVDWFECNYSFADIRLFDPVKATGVRGPLKPISIVPIFSLRTEAPFHVGSTTGAIVNHPKQGYAPW